MKLIKEKKIYTGNGVIENGYIRFDEKIEEVGDMAGFEPKEGDLEVSCAGTMVVPGFIDIHSHGGYGKDNMDATPDEIDEADDKAGGNHNLFLYNYDSDL